VGFWPIASLAPSSESGSIAIPAVSREGRRSADGATFAKSSTAATISTPFRKARETRVDRFTEFSSFGSLTPDVQRRYSDVEKSWRY
jgi:hypothetical protein